MCKTIKNKSYTVCANYKRKNKKKCLKYYMEISTIVYDKKMYINTLIKQLAMLVANEIDNYQADPRIYKKDYINHHLIRMYVYIV